MDDNMITWHRSANHNQPISWHRCSEGVTCRRSIVTYLLISHKPRGGCWNRIYPQKAHESSFPAIRLPNGNIVKFPHTNRKHFTVGDPMAFPIVKMENKNPQNVPFRLDYVDPHLIQQCLGPPQAPPETAAPTIEALSHTYAVKSPLVTRVRSKFTPKMYPFPWTDCQTPIPASSLDPSDLWCRTAAGCDLPFFHNALDRRTDRPTDRTFTGKFDDYRPLRSESNAA